MTDEMNLLMGDVYQRWYEQHLIEKNASNKAGEAYEWMMQILSEYNSYSDSSEHGLFKVWWLLVEEKHWLITAVGSKNCLFEGWLFPNIHSMAVSIFHAALLIRYSSDSIHAGKNAT